MLDTESGELMERRVERAHGEARAFYAELQGQLAHICLPLADVGLFVTNTGGGRSTTPVAVILDGARDAAPRLSSV